MQNRFEPRENKTGQRDPVFSLPHNSHAYFYFVAPFKFSPFGPKSLPAEAVNFFPIADPENAGLFSSFLQGVAPLLTNDVVR